MKNKFEDLREDDYFIYQYDNGDGEIGIFMCVVTNVLENESAISVSDIMILEDSKEFDLDNGYRIDFDNDEGDTFCSTFIKYVDNGSYYEGNSNEKILDELKEEFPEYFI
jgi:hypothetical protein